MTLKREFKRRKDQVLSGEMSLDEFNTQKDANDDRDAKTIELCKKQHVNVKGPLIDEDINCKICDLGNGCWTHYHFVPKIQTR